MNSRGQSDIESVAANWILRRDAGLSREEAVEFARWQAADPRHAEAVARKEKAWSALGRPLASGQANVLLARLQTRAVQHRRRRIGMAVAAACVVGLVSIFRFGRSSHSVAAQAVVTAPVTQTLPDGSVVERRPGSELVVDFTAPLRRVVLTRGTVHFEVAKDPARPFVVRVGRVEVRAVGTAFSVDVGNREVEVLVTEGRVAVQDLASGASAPAADSHSVPLGGPDAAAGEPLTLAQVDAGNRVVVPLQPAPNASAPAPTAVTADEMTERQSWRVPRLEFSALPLAEAVALMNRYNTVHFAIDDAALARLRISGIFRADNIDTFVRLLEGTCGIKAVRAGDTIFLQKAGG